MSILLYEHQIVHQNISDELFGARRGEYSFKGEVESKVKSLIERIEEITD